MRTLEDKISIDIDYDKEIGGGEVKFHFDLYGSYTYEIQSLDEVPNCFQDFFKRYLKEKGDEYDD